MCIFVVVVSLMFPAFAWNERLNKKKKMQKFVIWILISYQSMAWRQHNTRAAPMQWPFANVWTRFIGVLVYKSTCEQCVCVFVVVVVCVWLVVVTFFCCAHHFATRNSVMPLFPFCAMCTLRCQRQRKFYFITSFVFNRKPSLFGGSYTCMRRFGSVYLRTSFDIRTK